MQGKDRWINIDFNESKETKNVRSISVCGRQSDITQTCESKGNFLYGIFKSHHTSVDTYFSISFSFPESFLKMKVEMKIIMSLTDFYALSV